MTHPLTTFTTPDGELYIRVIPSKSLFKSTMVHEVVNRGDVFAIRVSDSTLTIISGKLAVEHSKHSLVPAAKQETKIPPTPIKSVLSNIDVALERANLRLLREQVALAQLKHGDNLSLW